VEVVIDPEVISISSIDLDYGDLPPDPEECSVSIDVEIGPKGSNGGDRFSFEVVTPKYLFGVTGTRWGRGLLIVNKFDWQVVESFVAKLLRHSQGETWEDVAKEISKEMPWEFENYQEPQI
jgi:hypothetical protein